MKALVCTEYGAPENLELRELEVPVAQPGQVLIEVSHAGVTFVDTLMVADRHQNKHPVPFAPGMEVAGRVAALGDGVTRFRVGQSVAALLYDGGYAECAVADESECFALPEAVDPAVAAGMLSVYLTSYLALYDAAALASSDRVVIAGAAGGVGLAAVDLATAANAEVIGIASTAEKRAVVSEMGARSLETDPETLRDRIAEGWSDRDRRPLGADVVFDPVAGPLWKPLLRSLAWGGRYLIIGFAGGEIPKFPANHLLVQQKSAIGFVLMTYRRFRHRVLQNAATDLFSKVAAGELRPRVDEPLPLEEGASALRRILDRQAIGKSVLAIR